MTVLQWILAFLTGVMSGWYQWHVTRPVTRPLTDASVKKGGGK